MRLQNKKIAQCGLLVAIGLIFGYIEFLFPLPIGVPGVKIGFSNIVTVICLYILNPLDCFLVLFIRVVLSGILFGNFYSILYSLTGALFSFLVMLIVKKVNIFSVTGISVCGGVFHNIGQLCVACITVSELRLTYYLPVLILSGVLCGGIIGIISSVLLNRVSKLKGE